MDYRRQDEYGDIVSHGLSELPVEKPDYCCDCGKSSEERSLKKLRDGNFICAVNLRDEVSEPSKIKYVNGMQIDSESLPDISVPLKRDIW